MLAGLSGHIGAGKDEVAKMIQFFTLVSPSKRDFGVYQGGTWQHHTHPWEIKKFAGKLKQIVSLLTGIPVADLEKESVKDSELGPEWSIPLRVVSPKGTPRLGPNQYLELSKSGDSKFIMQFMTVRSLLQKLGTDAMRDKVHPDCHVNALFADYLPIDYKHPPTHQDNLPIIPVYPNWIISDLRFPNEFKAIKDRGGICIRINRGKEYWNDPEWLTGKKVYSQPINLHPSETALDNAEFDYTIQNSGTLEELLEQVRTMLLHFKIIT